MGKAKLEALAFVSFHGVNTTSAASFKLAMGGSWGQTWEEIKSDSSAPLCSIPHTGIISINNFKISVRKIIWKC